MYFRIMYPIVASNKIEIEIEKRVASMTMNVDLL